MQGWIKKNMVSSQYVISTKTLTNIFNLSVLIFLDLKLIQSVKVLGKFIDFLKVYKLFILQVYIKFVKCLLPDNQKCLKNSLRYARLPEGYQSIGVETLKVLLFRIVLQKNTIWSTLHCNKDHWDFIPMSLSVAVICK